MSGITWLGHGSFQIDTPAGARVLIDPWLTGNPSWPEGLTVEVRTILADQALARCRGPRPWRAVGGV